MYFLKAALDFALSILRIITLGGTPLKIFYARIVYTCQPTSNETKTASNLQNINPLNAELNPICYLLALLGAHHFLHVSWIRVNHAYR